MMQNPPGEAESSIEALTRLLDVSQTYPPEYDDQLTSHLPMALHALQRMGAKPERLQEFHDAYSQRFTGLGRTAVMEPAADWRDLRGLEGAYPALLATFASMVSRDGADQVLRAALPDLLPGVAAAAFHALIRTAHAIESGHQAELANALAYWAWRWQPLRLPTDREATMSFDAWADRLVQTAQGWRTEGPLISIRMEEATKSQAYQNLAIGPVGLTTLPEAIARLAQLAAQRYVVAPNFTVLHMVTGLRALRVLSPWVSHREAVVPVMMRAFTAAYLAARVVPSSTGPLAGIQSWGEVVERALASNDDHVVKLVHACVDEAKVYGEGMYLQAACLAVR